MAGGGKRRWLQIVALPGHDAPLGAVGAGRIRATTGLPVALNLSPFSIPNPVPPMRCLLPSFRHCVALSALAVACGAHAQSQIYKLQLPLESDSDVVLQDIVVDAKQTRVTLVVKNTTDESFEACAQPTGSPDAFTLKDLGTGTVLPQLSIGGLSFCNVKMDVVKPGRNKLVKITFPPLPAGATRLQLGEANCQPKPDSDMDYWCFKNIVLPAR